MQEIHFYRRTTMNEITDALAAELLDYYSRVCNLDIRQKQAIQMLFDCRFVSLLMVPRENEPLTQQSNKLCNAITSKIDPFDFDVLRPFIYANVKRAAQRSLVSWWVSTGPKKKCTLNTCCTYGFSS